MCVCAPGISYIMGTKRPHKDSNISNFWHVVLISMQKQAYKSNRMIFLENLK